MSYTVRDRARAIVRAAFPRRRAKIVAVKSFDELQAAMRATLVDAVLVDVGAQSDDVWRIAPMAAEYPSAPFFGLSPLRVGDGPILARCASYEFADVLVDNIDESLAHDLILPHCFTHRFIAALREPPTAIGLTTDVQRAAWYVIVSHAGRPLRTGALAAGLGISREHLSRVFSQGTAPNLKRVIDLVRLLAAAELAKNPGFDIRDVASALDFASSSHLSSTSQRIVGTKPASLSRLRAVDLIDRFAHGRSRSRG